MIYLNTGVFKPMMIIISIIYFPIAIASAFILFSELRLEIIVVSVLLFVFYLFCSFGIYKHSVSKKYFITTNNDYITIKYPNIGTQELTLKSNQILKIEYYKLSSIVAWYNLCNYICPQCVFITFIYDGKEMCKHIGYPNFDEISKLCAEFNVNFVTK